MGRRAAYHAPLYKAVDEDYGSSHESLQLTTLTEISASRDAVNMELCGAVLVPILPSTHMSCYPDIDACIQAARLIATAGEMTPFPFIKGVAQCVIVVLETIDVRRHG